MRFISLSLLVYISQIQASSTPNIYSESTESIPSHFEGHISEAHPTTNTDITENDFLNETGGDISDAPNQVILHTTTRLRTRNTAARKRNVESGTESDHMGQNKLKKTGTLKRDSIQTSSATTTKPSHKSVKRHNQNLLRDETNVARDVLPEDANIMKQDSSQEQPISQISNDFEKLINQGNYKKIFELGKDMSDEEFLKQLCPVVKTSKQYNEVFCYLQSRKLVVPFYVHGDIGIVKEIIVAESRVYDGQNYVYRGGLETALPLALREDHHARVVDLLNIRKGITIGRDKEKGSPTSFEIFVYSFLVHLAPWEDGMALKRFFTSHIDELRIKHPDILDTLCQELVDRLSRRLEDPKAMKLLTDLIGQPLLLTPVSFANGFLYAAGDDSRSGFIKYGWREAIGEGLKREYENGGDELWQVMRKKYPTQIIEEYPPTVEAFAAVLEQFPTKQQKEEQWIEYNAPGFLKKVRQAFDDVLPAVLVTIVIEYARPIWIVV